MSDYDGCNCAYATPTPRRPWVWRGGDPEPAGVWAVLDAAGQVWQRDAEHTGWVWGEDWVTWMALAYSHGPLVEIVLPKPVTA